MNKTRKVLFSSWLFATVAGCNVSEDHTLDTPGRLAQMNSSTNVFLHDSSSSMALGGAEDEGLARGDFDGDGIEDLALREGMCVRIIYGKATWPRDVDVASMPMLVGESTVMEGCGGAYSEDTKDFFVVTLLSVGAAGDVDRDGFSDFFDQCPRSTLGDAIFFHHPSDQILSGL
jgi:hypothetical protein